MSRYVVGALLAAGLLMLLGAAGDSKPDPLEARVLRLEQDRNTMTSRMVALERRVADLEKKLGQGGPPAADQAGVGEQPTETATGQADPAAGADDEKLKQTIRNLRTANYEPVEGLENLWRSPMQFMAAGDAKSPSQMAVGRLRYIGTEDLKEYELHFKLIYSTKANTVVGMSEFTIEGDRLKPDRDYTFRETTPVREPGDLTCKLVYLNKTKLTPPTGYKPYTPKPKQ